MFHPSKKLDQKKLGPFQIIKKVRRGAYRLKLPKEWERIHPVFNEILLTPFNKPQFEQQKEPEPLGPVNLEGEPEFKIEDILSSRKKGRGIQYLIKWKGYGNEENTWEAKSWMGNAKEIIKEFHQKHPQSIQQIAQEIIKELDQEGFQLMTQEKDQGVFGMKPFLRKGYYQESLGIQECDDNSVTST